MGPVVLTKILTLWHVSRPKSGPMFSVAFKNLPKPNIGFLGSEF